MSDLLSSPAPPARTSGQAVWSLVLGILSITCLWLLGSVPAILLGVAAVRNIDRSGGSLKGRGLGIAGIVTGAVGVFAGLGTVAVVAAIAVPAFAGAQSRAEQVRELNHLKQLAIACQVYASDHEGTFPKALTELEPDYVDTGFLERASSPAGSPLYRPGLTATATAEPLLASPAPIRGFRIVAKGSGQVERVSEDEFQTDYAHLFP